MSLLRRAARTDEAGCRYELSPPVAALPEEPFRVPRAHRCPPRLLRSLRRFFAETARAHAPRFGCRSETPQPPGAQLVQLRPEWQEQSRALIDSRLPGSRHEAASHSLHLHRTQSTSGPKFLWLYPTYSLPT